MASSGGDSSSEGVAMKFEDDEGQASPYPQQKHQNNTRNNKINNTFNNQVGDPTYLQHAMPAVMREPFHPNLSAHGANSSTVKFNVSHDNGGQKMEADNESNPNSNNATINFGAVTGDSVQLLAGAARMNMGIGMDMNVTVAGVSMSMENLSVTPPFILKLCNMLNTKEFEDLVAWGVAGDTILVKDLIQFSNNVLPKYFKHKNFTSFLRQLNMYGFHTLRQGSNWREFKNELFKRNETQNYMKIKRKSTQVQGGGVSHHPGANHGSRVPGGIAPDTRSSSNADDDSEKYKESRKRKKDVFKNKSQGQTGRVEGQAGPVGGVHAGGAGTHSGAASHNNYETSSENSRHHNERFKMIEKRSESNEERIESLEDEVFQLKTLVRTLLEKNAQLASDRTNNHSRFAGDNHSVANSRWNTSSLNRFTSQQSGTTPRQGNLQKSAAFDNDVFEGLSEFGFYEAEKSVQAKPAIGLGGPPHLARRASVLSDTVLSVTPSNINNFFGTGGTMATGNDSVQLGLPSGRYGGAPIRGSSLSIPKVTPSILNVIGHERESRPGSIFAPSLQRYDSTMGFARDDTFLDAMSYGSLLARSYKPPRPLPKANKKKKKTSKDNIGHQDRGSPTLSLSTGSHHSASGELAVQQKQDGEDSEKAPRKKKMIRPGPSE